MNTYPASYPPGGGVSCDVCRNKVETGTWFHHCDLCNQDYCEKGCI
jgi:hypothetical protein